MSSRTKTLLVDPSEWNMFYAVRESRIHLRRRTKQHRKTCCTLLLYHRNKMQIVVSMPANSSSLASPPARLSNPSKADRNLNRDSNTCIERRQPNLHIVLPDLTAISHGELSYEVGRFDELLSILLRYEQSHKDILLIQAQLEVVDSLRRTIEVIERRSRPACNLSGRV